MERGRGVFLINNEQWRWVVGGCGSVAVFGYGSDGHNGFLFLLFLFSHFLACRIGTSHDFLGENFS